MSAPGPLECIGHGYMAAGLFPRLFGDAGTSRYSLVVPGPGPRAGCGPSGAGSPIGVPAWQRPGFRIKLRVRRGRWTLGPWRRERPLRRRAGGRRRPEVELGAAGGGLRNRSPALGARPGPTGYSEPRLRVSAGMLTRLHPAFLKCKGTEGGCAGKGHAPH